MTKFKALILGLLLLVPVFVFIFISTFGEHHFGLRTYFPVMSQDGTVKRTAAGDTIFHQVPDYTLLSHSGKPVTQKDLSETLYIASFFYTSCPDVCKQMSSQLSRIHEAFRSIPEVKLASFTVDPGRDSLKVLQAYATKYKADPERWFFLTGTEEVIKDIAVNGFFTSIQELNNGNEFIHSEKFFLVDKHKRIRGIYQGTDPKETDRLKLEINVLLDEYNKRK